MDLDRAYCVDKNFIKMVGNTHFPPARSQTKPQDVAMTRQSYIELFTSQILNRHIDLKARELKSQGLAYYTIGSSGHEGNAAIAAIFKISDPAFLHYRSGAFVLQRARERSIDECIYAIILSLIAAADDPIASGRHKVFGSLALNIPPQTSTIASHLPKALGCAYSLALSKTLQVDANFNSESVVLCSFGDASLNHSVAQGAINSAQWIANSHRALPLVFICEDNGLGISVPTPEHWIATTMQARPYIHYLYADGLNFVDVYRAAKQAEHIARVEKKPVFLHLKLSRLMGHAGSDVEQTYSTLAEIEQREFDDPLLHSARLALDVGIMTKDEIIELYEQSRVKVAALTQKAIDKPGLSSASAVKSSIIPPHKNVSIENKITQTSYKNIFAADYHYLTKPRNLAQLINYGLTEQLLKYPNSVLFGEDVAKKGGVYHVTTNLQQRFGQKRVFDTLLDETTILGMAVGLAHNGLIPIAEIQYLAYLHNAEDQIRGEAATLSFFSNGQFTNPMLVRIPSLAYQKGFGGHFHNDNSIAVLRDIPGIIVACPSNGASAVKLLRSCMELAVVQQRVVVFLEPIALYMQKDLLNDGDGAWSHVFPDDQNDKIQAGEVGVFGPHAAKIAIVSYANGYYLARKALAEMGDTVAEQVKIIDLNWLNPLPEKSLLSALQNCQQILIVDECRQSGSSSEALMALFLEQLNPLPKIKRLTADDCFIPLGKSWQYILPSKNDIIIALNSMLQQ